MTDLSKRIAALSPEQKALFEQQLKRKGLTVISDPDRIAKRDLHHATPLSFAQERLWFLHQLEPDNPFYNIPMSLRLSGDLDAVILWRSFSEIVRRHESCRTTFQVIKGAPQQQIQEKLIPSMPVVDLQELDSADCQQEVERLAIADLKHPFDISLAPLFRLTLLQLGSQEHVLLLTIHHTIADGWSRGMLLRELATLYKALRQGDPSPLPELPIQYADFAIWQRQWLQGKRLETQLKYWRDRLQNLPILQLPTDYPRPAVQSHRGAKQVRLISPQRLQELRRLAQREGITLFMLLLTAFKILLYRYTHQTDIVVGAPTANRTRPELEGLIGFFVNALVLRTDLSGEPSCRDLLVRVRETTMGAFSHQELPFEKLVEELQPDRSLSHNPLFQVVFQFQDASYELQNSLMPALDLPDLKLSRWPIDQGTTLFDLAISMGQLSEGLGVLVEYSTDLFESSTITRLLDHLELLLQGILTDLDQPISQLPLLTESETLQILKTWNQTEQELPTQHCVHHQVEHQADRRPRAIALKYREEQLSYQDLNHRANQLAHYLVDKGVEAGTLVGISMSRSLDLVVAVLGVWKTGAAYLPIDPNYPSERIAYMLRDAQVPILLTQETVLATLSQLGSGVDLIALDQEWFSICSYPKTNPDQLVTLGHLAYVIYTSGSTGQPKGVQICHRGLLNLVIWHQQTFGISEEDRATQLAGIAFDASVWETWPYLSAGATLVLIEPDLLIAPQSLQDRLLQDQIRISFVPTPVAEELLSLEWPRNTSLRVMLTGGDQLHQAPSPQIPFSLINNYGPTESSVVTTSGRVQPQSDISGVLSYPPPIGYPINNLQVYVLDPRSQPVPIGIPGELYIGGMGLAWGYLDRPDLTAERFIPDPFNGKGARLYRTGDQVRYREDGSLEFLGRLDSQIQIRGFRIELGEIEALLRSHPRVSEAVVIGHTQERERKQLVAFVTDQSLNTMENDPDWRYEQVSSWSDLFDETYGRATSFGSSFNITGWNSSYTGLPIPAEEMREWVETTVNRILNLNPKRVLEIGCGTGLLLLRLVDRCEIYWGTDFSEEALESIRQAISEPIPQLVLDRRSADQFEGIPQTHFDGVILNSVVQYFPSIEYLMQVIEGALQVIKPEGMIFVGDVRNFPDLEMFRAAIALTQAEDDLTLVQFSQRIKQAVDQEEELLIDPAFFVALQQQFPQITHVQIQPKRGIYSNELTQFRYDVTLFVESNQPNSVEVDWLDWQAQDLSIDSLRELLEQTQPTAIGISNIPNARLHKEAQILQAMDRDDLETVADLKTVLEMIPASGVDPEEFWSWEKDLPYQVEVIQTHGSGERYDVIFLRQNPDGEGLKSIPSHLQIQPLKPWTNYANDPLRQKKAKTLEPQLRDYLRQRLPEPMIPTRYILLDRLPLTPNGKVDRAQLIQWVTSSPAETAFYVAPRTPIEEILAEIMAEILGVDRVGIHDNFFDLGGHSLLSTQLLSRVRDSFQIELPLRNFFETPTVAGLAAAVTSTLSQAPIPSLPLHPVSRDQDLPLSFAQQRLWFLAQLQPDSPFYSVPAVAHLQGHLDCCALTDSLNAVIQRHEVLRTHIRIQQGRPVQIIDPYLELSLPVVDLSTLNSEQREQELTRLGTAEAQYPFDLQWDPLIRSTLLRMGDQDHVLFLTMHHIVSDGWSIGVLLRELIQLYEGFSQGQEPTLPELPIQYADFAIWQRQWLQGDPLEAQLSYWRHQLQGDLPILELPSDRPRPPIQSFKGDCYTFTLSASLTQALRQFSQQQGITLFMILLAAYQALLHRYTGLTDLLVGSPIANRNRSEIEGLIGFFVNTLVLRTDLSGDPSFLALLGRVQEVAFGAYAHQDLPFEKLVEELQPNRDLSHSPLIQTLFSLRPLPQFTPQFTDLNLEVLPAFHRGTSRFDLSVLMEEIESEIVATMEYDIDLFDRDTIIRLADHFQCLLTGAIVDPEQTLSTLPLLTSLEKRQILEWNPTQSIYHDSRFLHQLFEDQVTRNPNKIALIFADQSLTYQELNQQANQLAHHLRALNVGPEILVGLCMERSLEMIVAMLAILKAGGAYVPLDPQYPQERIAFMLSDSRVSVVLTQNSLLGSLPKTQAKVVCLDRDQSFLHQYSRENLAIQSHPKNLAYVIYTSGSTGVPKGVAIEHRSPVALCDWADQAFSAEQLSSVLASTSICFDLSIFEIFVPLSKGGQVVLVPNILHLGAVNLNHLNQAITLINTVPSAIAELLKADLIPDSVSTINLAGEPLHASLIQKLYEKDTIQAVYNLYGPSEDTTYSTFALMDPESDRSPSIGVPIHDTQVYILDAHLQLVPIGVPGEIYIGGKGLARGYLQRGDLTADRFIPHPFSNQGGERLYQTGDRARYQRDGSIEFLGRIDHQVKLRGFRIELGEIEARLNQHPEIEAGVALIRTTHSQDSQLVACISPKPDQQISVGELRQFLQDQLPDYMIPSQYQVLPQLPLTPNGKIDRRILTQMIQPTLAETDTPLVRPRTEVEGELVAIWQGILQRDRIGINDNFFELGGHSLLLVQVHRQICDRFGIELPIVELFRYPTIRKLSDHLSQIRSSGAATSEESKPRTEQLAAGRTRLNQRLQKAQTYRSVRR